MRRNRPGMLGGLLIVALVVTGGVLATPPAGELDRTASVSWNWLPWNWTRHRPHRPAATPAPPPTQSPTTAATVAPSRPPAPVVTTPAPVATTTMPPMPPMPGMDHGTTGGTFVNPYVTVDASKIPPGSQGSSEKLLRSGGQRGASDNGEFRTVCTYSHMAFDDPIVKPGQPGASHLHAFFGNTGTNAHSTAASIRTSGNSTCRAAS